MKNDIDTLIKQAIKLDRDRPVKKEWLDYMEKKLNIILPYDFKRLSLSYSYDNFSAFNFYALDLEDGNSVTGSTLAIRKAMSIPHKFLLLAEDDVSIVILETKNDLYAPTKVIWLAVEDAENLFNGIPLEYEHTVFKCFSDFFSYLIREEKKRNDNEVN